jgi:hypothetical protein
VKKWEFEPLLEWDTHFSIDERTYCIYPCYLQGLGLFSMDVVKVPYSLVVELIGYVKSLYIYGNWKILAKFMSSMQRLHCFPNYNQIKETNQNKWAHTYIHTYTYIHASMHAYNVRFINSSCRATMNKSSNYMFKGHEGNQDVECIIKLISIGEELFLDCNLNRIKKGTYVLHFLVFVH